MDNKRFSNVNRFHLLFNKIDDHNNGLDLTNVEIFCVSQRLWRNHYMLSATMRALIRFNDISLKETLI